jgi:hypothetical protein
MADAVDHAALRIVLGDLPVPSKQSHQAACIQLVACIESRPRAGIRKKRLQLTVVATLDAIAD